MHSLISFSSLEDSSSLEEYLLNFFMFSKAQLKKSELSKKFLQKRVRKGELVELPLDLINDLIINPEYVGPSINIIFRDKDVVIFDKPYNIHSHPLNYSGQDNCLSFFRQQEAEKVINLDVNLSHYDRGLLYRLDYGTSGVMFYINNEELLLNLRTNFNKLVKSKTYLAVVSGKMKDSDCLENYFKYVGVKRSKASIVSCDGKLGRLEYRALAYNSTQDISLIEISLITGLRHQIRAQLGALGYPILGDTLYGYDGKENRRIFLHAYKYEVEINNKKYQGVSKAPELFSDLFDLDGCF